MSKLILFLIGLLTMINLMGQQIFSDFQDADIVIGQPDFQAWNIDINDFITLEPSSVAVSSKGMLAVAEQKSGSVKIWNSIPENDGQPADVVVGNPDFFTIDNGPSQSYSNSFNGVAWSPDGNKLIASCANQNRVLVWNSIPVTNGQPADVVIGQPDFTSTGSFPMIPRANNLHYPTGIMVSPDGRLFIADMNFNRVLIWNSIPTENGASANIVMGQPTFNNSIQGTEPNRLSRPNSISLSPDGRLLVTCPFFNYIFIYDSIPASNQESATVVIGHEDFGDISSGLSDSTLYMPMSTTVTASGMLAIADFGNHRVLLYDSVPVSHGAHANVILGQPDFFTNKNFAMAGLPEQNNISRASDISVDLNGRLFISGNNMHRVMVFGDLPVKSADLSVTIKGSSDDLCELSNIVYKIKIFNEGPDTAYNVVSTSAFPYAFKMQTSNTTVGSYNKKSGYWQIPFIAPGDSAFLYLNGNVNEDMGGKMITTYANIISSSAIDADLSNNGTSVNVTILAEKIPSDPLTSDAILCSGEETVLIARGSGTMQWYANNDDLVPIATDSFFNTGVLNNDTAFFVEAFDVCASDKRVPVYVTVFPSYGIEETDYICSGDNYTFPDGTTEENILANISHTSYLASVTGCDSIITTMVNVTPLYNLTENLNVCPDNSYTFPDGTTVENIITNTSHISYLTSIAGCDSIITTVLNVTPVYNFVENADVCYNDSYSFPDGTLISSITSPMVHTSYLTTVQGCDSIIVTNINVKVVDVSVFRDGLTLIAGNPEAVYQWVDLDNNSQIPGETNQSFIAKKSGNYGVLINQDGCLETSDSHIITILGISDDKIGNQISVYPNPFSEILNIEIAGQVDNVAINIFNLNGQVVYTKSYDHMEKTAELTLDGLNPGMYLILIEMNNKKSLFRIVKE